MIYFIRLVAELLPEHFQAPRTSENVRRSLDGSLCIVAFDPGTEPFDWNDGMTQAAMVEHLNSPESQGVWYQQDFQ